MFRAASILLLLAFIVAACSAATACNCTTTIAQQKTYAHDTPTNSFDSYRLRLTNVGTSTLASLDFKITMAIPSATISNSYGLDSLTLVSPGVYTATISAARLAPGSQVYGKSGYTIMTKRTAVHVAAPTLSVQAYHCANC